MNMQAPGPSRLRLLLSQRRFLPLFITQFLGALNDNVLKNALVVLLTFQVAQWTTLRVEYLANLASASFILPFFLFSASAGELADRYDKAAIARGVKLFEIFIVLVAGLGFAVHRIEVLFFALFLLGLHSTFFGPVKYAILPQHLAPEELLAGNTLIEAGTFVAILFGSLGGSLLAATHTANIWITLAGLIFAGAGFFAARGIPAAVSPAPTFSMTRNPLRATWRNIATARRNPELFGIILAISWFWLYGALFLTQFPAFAKIVLAGSVLSVTALLVVFTCGIGAGSLLAEKLARPRHDDGMGLVRWGALGMSLFSLDLWLASPSAMAATPSFAAWLAQPVIWRVLLDLGLVALCGGLFSVPLYTRLQQHSPAGHCARFIAANNIMNALFTAFGTLSAAALLSLGLTIPDLFGGVAMLNLPVFLLLRSRWR